MKLGVIDVGGGMRDIFGTGILDACLENKIYFHYGIGVSAGSGNLASYMSCQNGRNHRFYTQYAFRKEYMSLSNWIHTKNYMNLDYIYGTLANSQGEDPMDYDCFKNSSMDLEVVATDAYTGKAVYFQKKDIPLDRYDVFKASSCIPLLCKPYPIEGKLYFDGGLSDPIPVQRAFRWGCDKIILILTKPRDLIRNPKKDQLFAKLLQKKYPGSAQSLCQRAEAYNQSLKFAKKMEKEGRICILAPESIGDMKTLIKDRDDLERLYDQGRQCIKKIKNFI